MVAAVAPRRRRRRLCPLGQLADRQNGINSRPRAIVPTVPLEVLMRSHKATKVLTLALAATFWMPGAVSAQTAAQPGAGTQAAPANSPPQGQAPASGTSINPSQAPLQPVTTYPDAAGNAQSQSPPSPPDAPQPQQSRQPSNEPQGAATAERVP